MLNLPPLQWHGHMPEDRLPDNASNDDYVQQGAGKMIEQETYSNVRHRMQPGDVIAFGGVGMFSAIIKWWTRYPISHVGIVSRVDVHGGPESVRVMESTSLDGYCGVIETRLSQRIEHYKGEVLWLPLSFYNRMRIRLSMYWDYVYDMEGKPYDLWQAVRSATWDGDENFDRLFCSELVAGALEASGLIDSLNASAVTPRDICMFNIYNPTVYQLVGKPIEKLPGLNSINPEGFGQ